LTRLGLVEAQATFPIGPRPQCVVIITSAAGTLNFTANWKNAGPIQLRLQRGTGTYADWAGKGTLVLKTLQNGYGHVHAEKMVFDLSLKA
jgi:hypothetical protein